MTYTVAYGHWTLLQCSGALVVTLYVLVEATSVGGVVVLPFVVLLLVGIWWFILRRLVTRVHLVGRTLVVVTPLRSLQLSADEVEMRVPQLKISYAHLRGPGQLRGFELPNTEATRELARLIREG